MSTTIDQVIIGLFFGEGAWLGLLLMMSLILGLLKSWKPTGLLMLPVAVLFGVKYLDYNLGWHAIIMFLTATFIFAYLAKDVKGR